MKLYSYIIKNDGGFSPNPFWGMLTLACCKPKIRKTARPGDWIVGLSPRRGGFGNKIVYVVKIDEKMSFREYFTDKRFAVKQPDYSYGDVLHKSGDNIYQPRGESDYKQLQSVHSFNRGLMENPKTKSTDLSGEHVLVGQQFYYFGANAIELPEEFSMLKVGRGHKNSFSIETINNFIAFISQQNTGIHGPPHLWPVDDASWQQNQENKRHAPSRIILSRKGFDSGSGGCASPIMPDGRMLSLPIPDRQAPMTYEELGLSEIVSSLTKGKKKPYYKAHLDPDIDPRILKRRKNWLPLFGQSGSALKHLQNNDVSVGDVFLFFGLFRHTEEHNGQLRFKPKAKPIHALWGYFQIGEVIDVHNCNAQKLKWAQYHPHFHGDRGKLNGIYVASPTLSLSGAGDLPGAGCFEYYHDSLCLSDPKSKTKSTWKLPPWFYPSNGKEPLSYHGKKERWSKRAGSCILQSVARGQEFVLHCDDYPESHEWLLDLIKSHS